MRMASLLALVGVVALSGCAGVRYVNENYGDTRGERFQDSTGERWQVFDRPEQSRMMINVNFDRAATMGLVRGMTLNVGDTGPQFTEYERAAMDYLASKGRTCNIVRSNEILDTNFEVFYDCRVVVEPQPKATAQ